MAKVKEQVKYDPKWSDVKRVNAARMDIVGRTSIVLTIIFGIVSLLMSGVMICSVFMDDKEFLRMVFRVLHQWRSAEHL